MLKTFNVLPTDENFLKLTDDQILWIVAQLEIDRQEARRQAGGYDETFFDPHYEEWEEAVERGELGDHDWF